MDAANVGRAPGVLGGGTGGVGGMNWFIRLLHRFNVIHRPVQDGFLKWKCVDCLKIADADPYWGGFPPYDWRRPNES